MPDNAIFPMIHGRFRGFPIVANSSSTSFPNTCSTKSLKGLSERCGE